MKTLIILMAVLGATAVASAAPRPVVSYLKSAVGDSVHGVKPAAFDVLLREAIMETKCLEYVDMRRRDSIARSFAAASRPFTLKDMKSTCGVGYGIYFAMDRYGYLLRLSTRVTADTGTVLERVDFAMLNPLDSQEYRNVYEGAMRRLFRRVATALALRADTTCPIRLPYVIPVVGGGVVMHKMSRGFGMFLSDNAERVCNLALTRLFDTLRFEKRLVAIDIPSRDQIFARMGEFGVQNTMPPTANEIEVMKGIGIPMYVVVEVDSADNYRKVRVSVHVYSTDLSITDPLATGSQLIDPEIDPALEMEQLFSAVDDLSITLLMRVWEREQAKAQ